VGVVRVDISTAAEMLESTLEASEEADALIMAAAVADYRPIKTQKHKIKRHKGVPDIELEVTPDILVEVMKQKKKSGHPSRVIGFAAESQDLLENAKKKLEQKGLDLIVANDISATDAGFSADTNRVTILSQSGNMEELALMHKTEVAERIIDRLEALLAEH
jgi:phosphopantothenoylcysteine decarboxylase/phosphopantothenate--cysteine ligase